MSRTAPIVFNIRSNPFESYDTTDSFGHLGQKVSWIFKPMTELLEAHLKTLAEYLRGNAQGGTSFDLSNVVGISLRKREWQLLSEEGARRLLRECAG